MVWWGVEIARGRLPIILFVGIVPALVLVDLLAKFFTDGVYAVVIPRFLVFDSHHNTGIAFSWLSGAGVWLVIVTAVLCVGAIVAWWFMARKSVWASVGFALFVAGGLGNLYDRIFHGHVRDFIRFVFINRAPIFNLADVFLTVGTIVIAAWFIKSAFGRGVKDAS